MRPRFEIDCVWIPAKYGGRRTDPGPGYRPQIRWQRHIEEHIALSRGVEIEELNIDSSTRQGTAVVRANLDEPLPAGWLEEGELIELLESFHVVAVGRITRELSSSR